MAEVDDLINEPSEVEKRIKDLSGKAKTFAEERDTERTAKEEAILKSETSEKKAAFYKDFSKLSAKYSAAPEHLDEIEAKVLSGYDPEDATVSVLMKAGKFSPQAPTEVRQAAGGSATNTINVGATKSASEMLQADRRAALIAAEQAGDISVQ